MSDLAQQCDEIRNFDYWASPPGCYQPMDGDVATTALEHVKTLLAYIDELQAELAALRRPAAESEEVGAARIRDRNSLSAWFDGEARSHAEDAYRDRRALLAALDHSELEKALAGESWRDLMDACGLDPENTIIEQVAQLVNDLRSQLSAREAEISDLQCTSAMIVDAESRRLAAEAAEQEALSRLAAKDAEIARLKSPPEERGEIVNWLTEAKACVCVDYSEGTRHLDTLLQDCARYRNAHSILMADNARLTAANAEYTKRHVEQVARIERLETWLNKHADHADDCLGFMAAVMPDGSEAEEPCTCGIREILGRDPTDPPTSDGQSEAKGE